MYCGLTGAFFHVLQVEGPKSPEEMITILQKVLEESSPVLVSARLEAEERRNNTRLREEQDAAYQAALEADQVCNSFNLGFCLYHTVWCGPYGMLPYPFLPTGKVFLERTMLQFFLQCLITLLSG